MGSSFKIATIRGIPIRIHFSFLLVLPFLAFLFGQRFALAARLADLPPESITGNRWLWGLAVAVALFASVLVHELAHALYAQSKGGRVQSITLLMIGGVSQLTEPPKEARDEGIMAFMGPLTSLLIGGGCLGLYSLAGGLDSFNLRFAFFYLGQLNLILGFFNLLPAFPMDGGRILRSLLVKRQGPVRATRTAATVGKVMAILFAVLGLMSFNIILLLIAYFIYVGASAESRQVLIKAVLGRLHVRDLLVTWLAPVDAGASVEEATARMLRERRLAFPVVEDGKAAGVVTRAAVQGVEPGRRQAVSVREIARPAPPVSPDDQVWDAFRTMGELDLPLLPVVQGGLFVGIISQLDVLRALELSELERPGVLPYGPRRESPV